MMNLCSIIIVVLEGSPFIGEFSHEQARLFGSCFRRSVKKKQQQNNETTESPLYNSLDYGLAIFLKAVITGTWEYEMKDFIE